MEPWHHRYLQEINLRDLRYAAAKFRHPATVLRDRKDLEVVRGVEIEWVDSSNSEARFAFLSLFVNRKTAIDTLTATRGSN